MLISLTSRFSVNYHVKYNEASRIKFTECIKSRHNKDINKQRYKYHHEKVLQGFLRCFCLK